jgi:hypothetical protein
MFDAPIAGGLSLRQALIQWSDPALVDAVRVWEKTRTTAELCGVDVTVTEDHERRRPSEPEPEPEPEIDGSSIALFKMARDRLERDFRNCLIRGAFFLQGIQTRPERTTEPRPIPGAWAGDCRFYFDRDHLWVDKFLFVAVTAFQTLPTACATAASGQRPIPVITRGNVRNLTDEEVLLLLEEHARRVVESSDAKLITPGKISLMPIIRRRMLYRAERGMTRETLEAEAAELEEWIATKVPSHQVPKASTIENVLRSEYRPLKARSKSMIP